MAQQKYDDIEKKSLHILKTCIKYVYESYSGAIYIADLEKKMSLTPTVLL